MESFTCEHDGCSCVVVKSNQPVNSVVIPFIQTKQGNRIYGSSAISIDDLFGIADIPSLDFGKRYDEFCQFTSNKVSDLKNNGVYPNLWQRNGDKTRIRKGATWLAKPGDNSMPDGILIGERIANCTNIRRHSTIGDWEILELEITNNLIANCPIHGTFEDDEGNPIFQNRCEDHECPHHNTTTSPFQIIDGQHRSLILKSSPLANKQVAVSILLKDINQINAPGLIGYDEITQAKVFTQVNTESKDLDPLHKTWLKRFFGEWMNGRTEGAKAFDLLAEVGKNWPTLNNFQPFVKMHPRKQLSHRIDSVRGADSPAIQGKAAIESIIPALEQASAMANNQPITQILVNWMNASVLTFPTMFLYNAPGGGAGGVGVFDHNRPFEAYIRTLDLVLEHIMNTSPTFTNNFTQQQFNWSLQQHQGVFQNSTIWEVFLGSGENPWKELYVILRRMWSNPNPQTGELPAVPYWNTQLINGNPCNSWDEYIELHPDPIDNFNIETYCYPDSSVVPNGNLNENNNRAIISPNETLEWSRPVNCVKNPTINYRFKLANNTWTQWYNDFGSLKTDELTQFDRSCELSLTLGELERFIAAGNNAVEWDLRISYSNVIGTSSSTIGFVTT